MVDGREAEKPCSPSQPGSMGVCQSGYTPILPDILRGEDPSFPQEVKEEEEEETPVPSSSSSLKSRRKKRVKP